MSNKQQLVVRYKKGGSSFDILVKPGSVEPYREGKKKLDDILIVSEVFSNSSKMSRSKSSELKKAFSTDNKMECIKIILEQGTYTLTKKEMQEKVANKRREIINYIHKYYYNPKTVPPTPYPLTRIETVFNEINYRIDITRGADRQAKEAVKSILDKLPLKPMGTPDDVIDDEKIEKIEKIEYNKGNKGKGKGKGKNKSKYN